MLTLALSLWLKGPLIVALVLVACYILVVVVVSIRETAKELKRQREKEAAINKSMSADAAFGGDLDAKLIRNGKVIQHEKA